MPDLKDILTGVPIAPEPKLVDLHTGRLLCVMMYKHLSPLGYFPALTGGLLYKHGERKDIDIVLFRHRQLHTTFDTKAIEEHLLALDFTDLKYYGFVTKAMWHGYVVDLFNPEAPEGGEY